MSGIGKAMDELNAAIGEAEAALVTLNIGVRCSVQIAEWEVLIFGKHDQRWRLLWQDTSSEAGAQPLVNTSREVRLRAVQFLHLLPDKARQVAEAEVERTRLAVAATRAFTASVKSGGES